MNSTVLKIGAEQCTKEIPEFRIGDTVCVHVKIKEGAKERIQNYTGVVIARNGFRCERNHHGSSRCFR